MVGEKEKGGGGQRRQHEQNSVRNAHDEAVSQLQNFPCPDYRGSRVRVTIPVYGPSGCNGLFCIPAAAAGKPGCTAGAPAAHVPSEVRKLMLKTGLR